MKARYTHTQKVVLRSGMNGGVEITVKHNYEHSVPTTYGAREDAYYRQNGWGPGQPITGRPITARQERQLNRMQHRSVYRGIPKLPKAYA